jgi:hypothetical protein
MSWKKDTPIEKIREYNREYYQRKVKEKRALARQQAEKKVTTKECPICHSTFTVETPNQKYCCETCKKVATKIKGILYRQTKGYKESQKQYRKSEHYKEYRRQYAKSETYKSIMKKYAQSEKGKATTQRYSEKRKANGWKPLGTGHEE